MEGYEIVDGGWEGDEHAYPIIHDGKKAYAVDIPCRVYESGGGYSWTKIPGVKIEPTDVIVYEIPIEEVLEKPAERRSEKSIRYVSHKEYLKYLQQYRQKYPWPQYSSSDLKRLLKEAGIRESPEDVKEQRELEREAEEEEEPAERSIWINSHGSHGSWSTTVHGQILRIDYVQFDFSGQGRHYRITSRYNDEMVDHQFYKTLKEAQDAAVDMLTRHLKERESQGLKVKWDEPAERHLYTHTKYTYDKPLGKQFEDTLANMTFATKSDTAENYRFYIYSPLYGPTWRAPINPNDPRWPGILSQLKRPVFQLSLCEKLKEPISRFTRDIPSGETNEITAAICECEDALKVESFSKSNEPGHAEAPMCKQGETINIHYHPSGIIGTSFDDNQLALTRPLKAVCTVVEDKERPGNFNTECNIYSLDRLTPDRREEISEISAPVFYGKANRDAANQQIKALLSEWGVMETCPRVEG